MWAFFCIYAGLAALIHFGVAESPLTKALGPKIAMAFNLIFLLSGVGMYLGIGLQKGNIEAFGLILLAVSLAVRTVVNGWLFGFNPAVVNSYVLNAAFVFSCAIRLLTILRWPKLSAEIVKGQ